MFDSAAIRLIDGWKHPLSELKLIDGQQYMNSWLFASFNASILTKRSPFHQGANVQNLLEILTQMECKKAINPIYIENAKINNATYFEILNEIEEKFDIWTQKAVNERN